MTGLPLSESGNVNHALCSCGHPRHKHEWVSDMYPAMCGHADPVSVDPSPEIDPYDAICWCLEFEGADHA